MKRLNIDFGNRALALLTTIAMFSVMAVLVTPQPVVAACTGTYSWWSATSWGKEDSQVSSTCDDDDFYRGKVLDIKTDGHRVRVKSLPGGTTHYSGLSGGSWVNYSYSASGWVSFRLERVRVSDGVMTAYAVWGLNKGF